MMKECGNNADGKDRGARGASQGEREDRGDGGECAVGNMTCVGYNEPTSGAGRIFAYVADDLRLRPKQEISALVSFTYCLFKELIYDHSYLGLKEVSK